MKFIKPDNPFQNRVNLRDLQVGDFFFVGCGLCRIESRVDGLRAVNIRVFATNEICMVPDTIACQTPLIE